MEQQLATRQGPTSRRPGACIDHVEAFSTGGAHDISNFTTSCGRCNTCKSARPADEYLKVSKPWTVKGKRGEPEHWDGLASLFVLLARKAERPLTAAEKGWLREIETHYLRRHETKVTLELIEI